MVIYYIKLEYIFFIVANQLITFFIHISKSRCTCIYNISPTSLSLGPFENLAMFLIESAHKNAEAITLLVVQ